MRGKPGVLQSCSVLLLALLAACGTNPVTGKREIQFISEGQEIQIGQQNYAPMRQSEGGDYEVLPDLTAYVNEVGQKLAAASDSITVSQRRLPYEFHVLNSSVPNAWALPGGKIAVNRGLLTELKNEAELAAVLGHEIVHAAARHGAQAQERGTLLQGGLAAAQIGAAMGDVNPQLAGLLLSGASVGAQLVHTRYGREAELQSDLYGTRLMKAAGYDPMAAVTLQETFVRLSEGRQTSWLEGLFASHPPSQERVARNRETVQELGTGGDLGTERYAARITPLRQIKPAYDKYDQALAALEKKDVATARSLAQEAARLVPREGRFHQLLGDIDLNQKRNQDSLAHYRKAMELSPGYFGSWLGAGVAQYRLGNRAESQQWLARSMDLLPTAPAALFLGNIARDSGDAQTALKHYQQAASAQGNVGEEAAREAVRLDLPSNPGNYVAAALRAGSNGQPVLVVQNRAPVPLGSISVTPVLVNGAGQIVQQGRAVTIRGPVQPNEQAVADAGLSGLTAEQLQAVRLRIDAARVAQ
ncbi:MAG: M48 family metalloprotease [Steroidobacteraceae bacterium]